MRLLNFADEYIMQKVVTADNTDESDVAPFDNDKNFEPSDYSGTDDFDSDSETPLSNLVKDNSNNKNDNLNSLQSLESNEKNAKSMRMQMEEYERKNFYNSKYQFQ